MMNREQAMAEYARLERFGFQKLFRPQREGGGMARWDGHINKPFRVIGRAFPIEPEPMWVVEFYDGFRMALNAKEALM